MTFETSTLSVSAILIALSFVCIFLGHAETTCPEIVTIEKGGTGIVSCDNHGKSTSTAYWYIGDPATTSPILRLENGVPGGTLYGNGHYNITTSGAMIITNAAIQHEAVYSTLIYFQDDTDERNHIKVNITISPLSLCPVINVCDPCNECSLAVNGSGKLKCSLNGVRPLIPLKWIFKPQHGVSIVEHPTTVINNLSSDTWSSTAEISYAVSSCSQEAKFQCKAQDTFNLLGQIKSTVEIYTANCTAKNPEFIGATTMIVLIIVGVCFGTISTAGFVTYLFIHRSRGDKIQRQGDSPSSYTELSASQEVTDEYAQTLSSLKEHYKVKCEKARLPWAKSMAVEDIYAPCTCKITDSNDDKSLTSSDRLLTCKAIKDERLVVITGEPRHWETLFVEHFVHQWIHENKNNFILLLVDIKDISFNKKIIDILKQAKLINSEPFAKIIKNKKCVLLLHGLATVKLNESVRYDDSKTGESIKGELLPNLTLSNLFKQLGEGKLPQVYVWISMRKEGNIKQFFPEQFAKVCVSDVNVKQLGAFIDRVYEQRNFSLRQAPCGKNLVDNNLHNTKKTVQDTTNEYEKEKEGDSTVEHPIEENIDRFSSGQSDVLSQESAKLLVSGEHIKDKDSFKQEKNISVIISFFKQNQFFEEFKDAPMFLSVMAHAVIKKYCTHPTDFDEEKTLTTEGIVCTVINCFMEDNKLEHESKDPSTFGIKLGRLAMHLIDTQIDAVDMRSNIVCNLGDDVNFALDNGILQYSNKSSETQCPEGYSEPYSDCVEFSHRYLVYYFAAYYNIQFETFYTEALQRYDESKNFPVLRFTIHLKEQHIEQVLDFFRRGKNDDTIIDCLYKWDNPNGVRKVMTQLEGKDLNVTSLVNAKHRDAFKSFCEKCGEMQIHIKSLFVRGNVPMSFMTLDIPVLDELTFFDIVVTEEVFLLILEWLSQKNIILRFLKCNIPKTFSKKFKADIDVLNPFKLKVIRQPDETRNAISTFNYKTAEWT